MKNDSPDARSPPWKKLHQNSVPAREAPRLGLPSRTRFQEAPLLRDLRRPRSLGTPSRSRPALALLRLRTAHPAPAYLQAISEPEAHATQLYGSRSVPALSCPSPFPEHVLVHKKRIFDHAPRRKTLFHFAAAGVTQFFPEPFIIDQTQHHGGKLFAAGFRNQCGSFAFHDSATRPALFLHTRQAR